MGGGRCGWLAFHTEVSWGTSVNKGICVFYWWLHYHLRRHSKSPQSLEKESRFHILTNQARNDFRDNRSFAICYEFCPELLKLVEGHAQVGHFLFYLWYCQWGGRGALAATKILRRTPIFSGFAFCPCDLSFEEGFKFKLTMSDRLKSCPGFWKLTKQQNIFVSYAH